MDIKKLEITAKEESGVWFQHGDARFLVCSVEKPAYKRLCAAKRRPYRKQILRGTVPDETMDKLATEAMAEHLLIGWEGVTENGKAVPYSKEKATEYLTKYPKFADLISEFAFDQASFQEEGDAEGIENAKKGSPGNSVGQAV